jgi:hypothetical protein
LEFVDTNTARVSSILVTAPAARTKKGDFNVIRYRFAGTLRSLY